MTCRCYEQTYCPRCGAATQQDIVHLCAPPLVVDGPIDLPPAVA